MNLGTLTYIVFNTKAKRVVNSSSFLVQVFPKDNRQCPSQLQKNRAKMVREFKNSFSKNCGI